MRVEVDDQLEALLDVFHKLHVQEECCQEPRDEHFDARSVDSKVGVDHRQDNQDAQRDLDDEDPDAGIKTLRLLTRCQMVLIHCVIHESFEGNCVHVSREI